MAYALHYSRSADRANSIILDGAALKGDIYVHIDEADVAGITQVEFYVNDPTKSGDPYSTEGSGPWDINGGSGDANVYRLSGLTRGEHTILASITGTPDTDLLATFRVTGYGFEEVRFFRVDNSIFPAVGATAIALAAQGHELTKDNSNQACQFTNGSATVGFGGAQGARDGDILIDHQNMKPYLITGVVALTSYTISPVYAGVTSFSATAGKLHVVEPPTPGVMPHFHSTQGGSLSI